MSQSKTRKLIAAIPFSYGDKLHKAEAEFVAAIEDVENLVSRGLAYVKGQTPVPVNSGMQDPINPAKEAKKQLLVQRHLTADPGSAVESTVTDGNGGNDQTPEPPVEPQKPADPPADPPTPDEPEIDPQALDSSQQPTQ